MATCLCSQFCTSLAVVALGQRSTFRDEMRISDSIIDWAHIRNAAASGCTTCALLQQAVLCFSSQLQWVVADPTCQLKPSVISCKGVCRSFIGIQSRRFGSTRTRIEFFLPPYGLVCPWPLGPSPRDIRSHSYGRKLEQINSWIQTCHNDHLSCRPSEYGHHSEDSTPLPKRVLCLESRLLTKKRVRLYEPQSEEVGRYICLSHRWGSSQPLRTTSQNLQSHKKKGISWGEVPKTFQGAIILALQLGIRYVWIDSLCIVQDDPTDWNEQSALMCDIYQNAWLTIAASNGLGCHDELIPSYQHIVEVPDDDGFLQHVCVGLEHDHLFANASDDNSLLSRGWVMQERCLSRRVLYCHHDELIWECTQSAACECPEGNAVVFDGLKSRSNRLPKKATAVQLQRSWHRTVTHYSGLNLSRVEDRQVAILGLAGEMKPFRKGRYLAGLWEDNLLLDLAWYLDYPESMSLSGSEKTRAPSWSWTSTMSRCHFASWGKWRNVSGFVTSTQKIDMPPDARVPQHHINRSPANMNVSSTNTNTRSAAKQITPPRAADDFGRLRFKAVLAMGKLCCRNGNTSSHDWLFVRTDGRVPPEYDFKFYPDRVVPDSIDVALINLGEHPTASYALALALVEHGEECDLYKRVGLVEIPLNGRLPMHLNRAADTVVEVI